MAQYNFTQVSKRSEDSVFWISKVEVKTFPSFNHKVPIRDLEFSYPRVNLITDPGFIVSPINYPVDVEDY